MSKRKIITAVLSALVVIVLATGEVENRQIAADVGGRYVAIDPASCVDPKMYNATLDACVGPDTTQTTCFTENIVVDPALGEQNCNVCRNAYSGDILTTDDCVGIDETRVDICPDGREVPIGTSCDEGSDCVPGEYCDGDGDGYNDAICSDVYDEYGNCSRWCTDPARTDTWPDGECQDFGGDSCGEVVTRDDGRQCQTCTDYAGFPSETCWGGEDINPGTVPQEDIDRTRKDMNKQLNQIEKDLGRRIEKDIAKRLSRELRNDQKAIARTQKTIEKAIRKDFPQEEIDRLIEDLENLQARVAERTVIAQKANDLSAAFRRDFENTKVFINNLFSQSTLTWDDMDSGWKKLNKLNFYWTLADVLDIEVNVAQSFGELNDFWREISRVQYMYVKSGAAVPAELDDLKASIVALENAGTALIAQAEDIGARIRELSNAGDAWESNEIWELSDELRWAQQDYWDLQEDWRFDEPWRILDGIRFAAECYEQTGYMKEEIVFIREDIAMAEQFVDAIEQLGVASLAVDIDGARRVIANGRAMVAKMEAELATVCDLEDFEDFDYGGGYDFHQFERFWPAMEQLGRVAQKYITRLVDYILDNSDAYDEVVSIVGQDVVDEMIGFAREDMHGGGDFQGDYSVIWENYEIDNSDVFSGLEQKLSGEIASMLQRGQIDAAIMEEIANLIVDAVVERMTAAIMNSFAVLGDQLGNQLMQNNNLIAGQAIEISGLSDTDEDLIEKAKTTVYVNSSTAEECASILEELKLATETGDNTGIFTQRLRECVDRANEESVKGENSVQFSDALIVDAAEVWFVDPIIDAKQKGIVSGYTDENGNPTGEFGPGNYVTVAEVTKMAAEASDNGISSGTPADSRAHGEWFSGYVKTFENIGLPALVKVDDWNKAATRRQAFIILAVMLDLDETSYRNIYPDVAAGDPGAGYFQTLYDLGIVTGEGDGNLNPTGLINRAAAAKIMTMSTDTVEEVQYSEALLEEDFDLDPEALEDFLNSFGGFAPPMPTDDGGMGGGGGSDRDFEEFEDDEDFEDFEEDLFEGFDDDEMMDDDDEFDEEFDFDEISAVFAPLPL